MANKKTQPFYNIQEVSNLTGLEESSIQYYENVFSDLLPAKVFRSDKALFQSEAVDIFRRIHQWVSVKPVSVEEIRALLIAQQNSPEETENTRLAKVLGMTSGKGGVGKSSLSLNLALEIHRRGYRTVLFDADLGTANLHILAGVTPVHTLYDVTHGTAGIDEILTQGPEQLGLIAGGSGVCQLANLQRHRRFHLISELEKLEACVDVLMIDTAPGISGNVTDFLQVCDLSLVLTTPDLTSITDAYGLIKSVLAEGDAERLGVVPNMVRSGSQAQNLYERLGGCVHRFLDFDIEFFGHVVKDQAVVRSALYRKPFLLNEPACRASRCIRKLADKIEERFLGGHKHQSSVARLWDYWTHFAETVGQPPPRVARREKEKSAF
jgi:flagellar biosynthesis protein FlhG